MNTKTMSFNKYQWLEEQKKSLREYLANEPEATYDDLYDHMLSDIDNDCIYYTNCWDICKQLAPVDEWDKMELAPITNISQLAYAALYEFATDNIDIEDILEGGEE
jgi:hypothetical protein